MNRALKSITALLLGAVVLVFLYYCYTWMQVKDVSSSPARISADQGTYDGDCPPQGSTTQPELMLLNRAKNTILVPGDSDYDRSVTLEKMLQSGYDRERWTAGKGAEIEGYVANVMVGGVETCNCRAKEHEHRDTHIELVLEPMNEGTTHKVIVEVTPRIRQIMVAKGEDWSTDALRRKLLGRWIKVKGWMLFDTEHLRQADNTFPNGPRNWRGTCWEVHPVTSIEVINRPI